MIQKRKNLKRYNSTRGKTRHKNSIGMFIASVFMVVIIIAVFMVARNTILFITESRTDSNDAYPVKGVDVSVFQKEINWDGLEEEGFRFAFIKATEGSSHVDGNFEYNWNKANKTDMKVGAYHFMSFDTSGEDQAENYINTVDRKWGMLPPVIDVEFYSKYIDKHPSAEKVDAVLEIMLDILEKEYGRKPIIYTNTYIYNTYILGKYDDYSIWISDPDIPETLPDGREWTFCQYTFRGTSKNVADGEKYVDMNVYNGSEWDFRRYNGK